jgi:hypothetical protein
MSEYRLKIKIGNHEFEAEGPADAVARQFADFKGLIAKLPDTNAAHPTPAGPPPSPQGTDISLPSPKSNLTKIFRVDGRVISLTASPVNGEREAALLLLLGQKELRSNDAATGGELLDGLVVSGYKLDRVDRMMDAFVADGLVMVNGRKRGKRYRLSNPGLAKAQAIADELMRKLP